ncbi:MAG: CbiX/SirB N-terminal domain-containing protein [Pseudomonadota bacterium]
MTSPTSSAVLLFAHGSSDPAWAAPFEKIRARVAAQSVNPVALAYLERMSPTMDDAVAQLKANGANRITVVPLFFAAGGHMKNDLPVLVRDAGAKHQVEMTMRQSIGESDVMIEAIASWATSTIAPSS